VTGCQSGDPFRLCGEFVRLIGSLPSGLIVQMSKPLANAIRVPSGDHSGSSIPETGVGTAT